MKYAKPKIAWSLQLECDPNYGETHNVTIFNKPCGSMTDGIWTLPNGVQFASGASWYFKAVRDV